jgi:O-antigen ligase
VSLFFAVYLHILAAKTGLLVFYVLLTCILARTMFYKPLVGLMLLLLVAGSATLAYQYIPTLRARIDYTVYSYSLYFKGERNADYSDQGRMISYDVGSHIIRQNPLLGVGAGDMIYEMGRGYRKMYPSVREDQYLIPHNQFMIIALAAGLPAMLAFLVWLVMPLFQIKSGRAGFYFVTIWLMLLVPLFTYPALEVQFGIFVFLLFLLLQKHVMDKPVEV